MYQLWNIVESQFWERWHTTTQIEDLDADLDSFEFENADDVDLVHVLPRNFGGTPCFGWAPHTNSNLSLFIMIYLFSCL